MMNFEFLKPHVKFSKYVPYNPAIRTFYSLTSSPHEEGVQPYSFVGWRKEALTWHESCYLHSGLNPHNTHRFTGPGVLKLLQEKLINKIDPWPFGKAKHAVICNEQGFIMADGVIVRLGENEFIGMEMSYLAYLADTGDYQVEVEDITKKQFNFQLAGPRSLDILEAATKKNLREIRFMECKESSILDIPVYIIRIGMSGTLGYEVHGKAEDAITIYSHLMEVGAPFGLQPIGHTAYEQAHIEGGFAQNLLDFMEPWCEDSNFYQWLVDHKDGLSIFANKDMLKHMFSGSAGNDPAIRYRNPFDVGWDNLIDWNKDFVGKEALLKISENPGKCFVTLEWNVDDLVEAYRDTFTVGAPMYGTEEPEDIGVSLAMMMDEVQIDGKTVGYTSGRMFSSFYRKVISSCTIDKEFAIEGTEVMVVRGDVGQEQRLFRANVARHPYINTNRNDSIDVSKI